MTTATRRNKDFPQTISSELPTQSNSNDSPSINPKEQAAAIKIQSCFRGHLARLFVEKEKPHFLSYSLFERAKPYVDDQSKRSDLPTAASGLTSVYLPKELPVVLKFSGFDGSKSRFEKMKQARQLCEKNGYSHLAIPTARPYKGWIIESHLPIPRHDTKNQIGIYLDNLEKFTKSVGQFTGFLFYSFLGDIVGASNDPYKILSQVPIGRYDNLVAYLDPAENETEGKLALVDLEKFSLKSKEEQKQYGFHACKAAVSLFPCHLDTIIQEAKKLDPNAESYRKDLEIERDKVLEFFKKAYTNHLDFVKQNNISYTEPLKLMTLPDARRDELWSLIEPLILQKNKDDYIKGFLGEDVDGNLKNFKEKTFPEILDALLEVMNLCLTHLRDYHEKEMTSYQNLLMSRTLHFPADFFVNTYVTPKLNMLQFTNGLHKVVFGSFVTNFILKELENGKEIAYYHPRFYRDNDDAIFC